MNAKEGESGGKETYPRGVSELKQGSSKVLWHEADAELLGHLELSLIDVVVEGRKPVPMESLGYLDDDGGRR